jgi:hypothetical protein
VHRSKRHCSLEIPMRIGWYGIVLVILASMVGCSANSAPTFTDEERENWFFVAVKEGTPAEIRNTEFKHQVHWPKSFTFYCVSADGDKAVHLVITRLRDTGYQKHDEIQVECYPPDFNRGPIRAVPSFFMETFVARGVYETYPWAQEGPTSIYARKGQIVVETPRKIIQVMN